MYNINNILINEGGRLGDEEGGGVKGRELESFFCFFF